MTKLKIECNKTEDGFCFKTPTVIRNTFGNKKTVYVEESMTMEQIHKKIACAKKQLTLLNHKKALAKEIMKTPLPKVVEGHKKG